jgi:hypothetical protein
VSQLVEVKTAELVGPALDWAVAMAEFWEADRPQDGQIRKGDVYMLVGPFRLIGLGVDKFYSPSTNWAQGGPLIDKHSIDFNTQGVDVDGSQLIEATAQDFECMECWSAEGETRLIAACRAIVSAKFGDAVKVPAELVGEVK